MRSREEEEEKRPQYQYESADLYRDSCTMMLPPNSLLAKGLGFSINDDQMKQALTQKRHIEERTSLLTGLYQKDKYAEDYFMDPTTSVTQAPSENFFMDDPTIVPTKIAPVVTYQSVLHSAQQEDVEMYDESAATPAIDPFTS